MQKRKKFENNKKKASIDLIYSGNYIFCTVSMDEVDEEYFAVMVSRWNPSL